MTMNKKKLAAMSAAVFTYIKTEEETAYTAALSNQDQAKQNQGIATGQAGTAARLNIWGSAGRQNQMQMHSMIQMRVFK